jgi:hypothetical protein
MTAAGWRAPLKVSISLKTKVEEIPSEYLQDLVTIPLRGKRLRSCIRRQSQFVVVEVVGKSRILRWHSQICRHRDQIVSLSARDLIYSLVESGFRTR